MFGLHFKDKIDTRKLMLDYTFEGFPLTKPFPAIGYEEIEYDIFGEWMIYYPLRIREGNAV